VSGCLALEANTPECAVPIILTINDATPDVSAASYIAADAVLCGNVTLGVDSTIWFGVVARAEYSAVTIGARTNVQDGTVLHADPGSPCIIGDDVTIGHRAVIHGCTLEDGVLVGMGAVVLNGAVVGAGSLVAAGAVVKEGAVIPPNSLVAGVPAKVVKDLGEGHDIYMNVAGYVHLGEVYAAATSAASDEA
jgi:carbonic anhydrase/acetyltransferase-like protein (isoleucine patch superfamily)